MNETATSPMEQFRGGYLPLYREALSGCEERLARLATVPGGKLGEACGMTLAAGGKRLRPLLVFLSAGPRSGLSAGHHAAAVAVELVHMATLVHDDVLDGAALRRGQPTVVASHGPRVSTAAGDYLFAAAFEILAAAGSEAVSLLADTSLDLSRGELLQMEQARDYSLALSGYEERCRLKTAGLFSTACCLGAVLSGAGAGTLSALREYGRCLGLAFQIADDILDYAGETGEFGKRIGTDLRDGTVTLPLMAALERDAGLPALLAGEMDDAAVTEICRRVRDAGGLEAAAGAAEAYVHRAREALAPVAGELDPKPLILIARMAADRKV
ncbi:MAG: polyprenyl synthetase family protein [Thermoleophilia bacterium]